MIKDIINNLYPNWSSWSSKRKGELYKFLTNQNVSDAKYLMCIKLIEKIYQYCEISNIEIELMFDEKIGTDEKIATCSVSYEQIQDLNLMGINFSRGTENELILQLCNDICNDFNSKKIYLNIDDNFLEIKLIDNKDIDRVELTAIVNCKTLSTKELRNIKLKNLYENIIEQ